MNSRYLGALILTFVSVITIANFAMNPDDKETGGGNVITPPDGDGDNEPIEPEQSQLLLSSIKEGDLSVTSMIPISNMSISYTTCIPSATRIEEELLQTQTIQDEQDAMILDNAVNIAMLQLMM